MNPERVSPLDVDIDTEGSKKEAIIKALQDKYGGYRHVTKVQTISTAASKKALQIACFRKGTLIDVGNNQLKPIESITNNDKITTYSGIEQVIAPTITHYKGEYYKVSNGWGEDFECTANHEFLVYKSWGTGCKEKCQLLKNKKVIGIFDSVDEATTFYQEQGLGKKSVLSRFKQDHEYELVKCINDEKILGKRVQWLPISKIKKRDYFLTPIDFSVEYPLTLTMSKEEQNPLHKSCNYIPEEIPVTNELCELLGAYLAEGNINYQMRGVTFTINIEEEDFKNHLIYLVKKIFQLNDKNIILWRKNESKGLSIIFYSTPLGRFFNKYFCQNTQHSYSKIPPNWALKLPPKMQLEIFKWGFIGDGYARVRENGAYEAKLTTTSLELAKFYWDILARNKYNATCIYENRKYNKKAKHAAYNISIYGKNAEILYDLKYNNVLKPFTIEETSIFYKYNGHYFYRSRNVKVKKQKGILDEDVYCLIVPSHNFMINHMITHNCRGLGYTAEDGVFLGSFIKAERGILFSLKQTFYGDEENNLAPDTEFVNLMTGQYRDVWEVAQKIEGLCVGSGQHAGGVILSKKDLVDSIALMKTKSGDITTQFDLHNSEACSLIKWDILNIDALEKIHTELDLLVEDGYIEWQGDLKSTYEKYLGVYSIERQNPEIWDMICNHKIMSLFQFEKQTGWQCIELGKPRNLEDMAALNSVMRLMPPDPNAETPLQKYSRFKQDISLWYKEMREYGLTEDEIKFLEKYALKNYGLLPNQENFMQIVQAPEVGGFNLLWADRLRKSIAKKNPKQFVELQEEYYDNMKEKGLSEKLCHYTWDILISMNKGYGF